MLNAKDKSITILVHVLVWLLLIFVLFMYPPLAGAGTKLPVQFWIKQLFHILLMLTAFYLNAVYLVPRLLLKNTRIVLFVGCVVILSLVSSFLLARIDFWLDLSGHLERAFGKKMWTNPYLDFFGLMTTMLVLGISTSVTIIQHLHRDAKDRQEFESQHVIAELSFLKAQINPHFFFNTLNSIYALTYINVETSRAALLKLSRMMRYLLYETQQNTTLLSRELEFMQDYIEIMQLRLNKNTEVQFSLPAPVEEMPVAPMLLLPFIENAFKHGVDDQKPGSILINIQQLPRGLDLVVQNNIIANPQKTDGNIEDKGIGLVNTKRRLDLLYKNAYSLNIDANHQLNKYHLHLQIKLL